jgi:hypothetical protein
MLWPRSPRLLSDQRQPHAHRQARYAREHEGRCRPGRPQRRAFRQKEVLTQPVPLFGEPWPTDALRPVRSGAAAATCGTGGCSPASEVQLTGGRRSLEFDLMPGGHLGILRAQAVAYAERIDTFTAKVRVRRMLAAMHAARPQGSARALEPAALPDDGSPVCRAERGAPRDRRDACREGNLGARAGLARAPRLLNLEWAGRWERSCRRRAHGQCGGVRIIWPATKSYPTVSVKKSELPVANISLFGAPTYAVKSGDCALVTKDRTTTVRRWC